MKRRVMFSFLSLLVLLTGCVVNEGSSQSSKIDSSSVDSSSISHSSSSSSSSSDSIKRGTISYVEPTGGTLAFKSWGNHDSVPLGTKVEVIATPFEGYLLETLTVNSSSILEQHSFFVEEEIEYVVEASFKKEKLPTIEEEGHISFSNLSSGSLSLSLDNLVLDNVEVKSISSSTLYNEGNDEEVRLGTSSNKGKIVFSFEENLLLNEVILEGEPYHNDSPDIQVSTDKEKVNQSYTNPSYSFSGLETSTLTIETTISKNRYLLRGITLKFGEKELIIPEKATIKTEQVGEGTVVISPSSNWYTGDEIEVLATPSEHYYLSSLTLNGENGARLSNGKTSFEIVDTENLLKAVFKEYSGAQEDYSYLYANTSIYPDRGAVQMDIDAYYEPVRGLKGAALKKGLHDIIDDHVEFSYDDLGQSDWEYIDEDPFDSSRFYVIYEGSTKKGYKVNKEHTWAKSHGSFGTSRPAGSDVHNLRGANSNLNSTRSNLDFGEVNHSSSTSVGDKYDWATTAMMGNYRGDSAFEPKDSWKGDVARIIFYMATRYEGNGEPNLEVSGNIDTSRFYDYTSGASGLHGNFEDLYNWATSGIDPVDDYEINRNNIVDQDYQHNRNPFIDHPEFIIMIYDKNYDGPGALL